MLLTTDLYPCRCDALTGDAGKRGYKCARLKYCERSKEWCRRNLRDVARKHARLAICNSDHIEADEAGVRRRSRLSTGCGRNSRLGLNNEQPLAFGRLRETIVVLPDELVRSDCWS